MGALSVDTLGIETLFLNLEDYEPLPASGLGGFMLFFSAPFAFFHFLPFLSRSALLALVGLLGFVEVILVTAFVLLNPYDEESMNDSRKDILVFTLMMISIAYILE